MELLLDQTHRRKVLAFGIAYLFYLAYITQLTYLTYLTYLPDLPNIPDLCKTFPLCVWAKSNPRVKTFPLWAKIHRERTLEKTVVFVV